MPTLPIEQRIPRSARTPERGTTNLVGPHFGILEELERVWCEPDDVPLAVYAGRLCRTTALQGNEAPRAASGAALNAEDARAACLGEAVERYSAALVRPGSVVAARATELAGDVLTPDRFALFSARQHVVPDRRFPFQRWKPRDLLTWAKARCLSSGRVVQVPAVFVHQPHRPAAGEPLIAPTLSTGLAAGTSETGTVTAGLCEVIERDAVALAWLGRIRPPRIVFDPRGDDSELATIVRRLNERGFRWAAFDLTTDLKVPVAAALIEGNSSLGRIVSFGSACHSDAARALRKALVEAAHCRMYVKSLVREQPAWNVGRRLHRVESFADHARFYTCHPAYRHALDRWWNTPHSQHWTCETVSGESGEGVLANLLSRVAQRGFHAYGIDLTPPDVESLGWHVVRVLVPGLQPLHGHHAWPHLGGARLRRLSAVFGPQARQPWSWNRAPHPCP